MLLVTADEYHASITAVLRGNQEQKGLVKYKEKPPSKDRGEILAKDNEKNVYQGTSICCQKKAWMINAALVGGETQKEI